MKTAGMVQSLYAKINSIDNEQSRAAQPHLGRIIEFALACAGFSDGCHYAALHVHDIDLVAEGVGDVNALLRGIDRDSRGTLEETFSAFQGADHAPEFPAAIEHENLSRLRVGHINIVLRIHRNALRRDHRILAAVLARQELVFLFREVEDVDTIGARIGHNDASVRIGRDAVGIDQEVEIRFARDDIDHASPETALRLYLALQAEGALECELTAAVEQQLRGRGLPNRSPRLLRGRRGHSEQRHESGGRHCSQQSPQAPVVQKKSNHRDTPMKYEFAVPGGVPLALTPWLNLVTPASTPILRKWYCICALKSSVLLRERITSLSVPLIARLKLPEIVR